MDSMQTNMVQMDSATPLEASRRTTGGVNLNEMNRLFGLELILERWRFQKPEAFGVFSLGKLFN